MNAKEFEGTTKQHLIEIDRRLEKIESKLDEAIERNNLATVFISSITSIIVAVIATLTGFKL